MSQDLLADGYASVGHLQKVAGLMAFCCATVVVSVSAQTDFILPLKDLQAEFRQSFREESLGCSGGAGGSSVLVGSSLFRGWSTSGVHFVEPKFNNTCLWPWLGCNSGGMDLLRDM